MKYFAKYLPVEGEITVGDTYVNSTFPNNIFTYPGGEWRKVNSTKVALFLCSSDIKVGDKVYSDRNGDPDLEHEVEEQNIEGLKKLKYFKVIGAISPAALGYVKEGDEFKEEEVHFEGWVHGNCLIEADTYEAFITHGWIEAHPDEYEIICTIKGHCGHFH